MPFDLGSFFTPRFPVIKRDRSMEPLGPELPPDYDYNKYGLDDRPEWKKKIQGLFESGVDTAAGFLGLPAYPETRSYGMGELTNAGIPFLALGKKLKLPEINKKPIIWRGDPGGHREINPQYFNRKDTLGYMAHAAEDQDYALNSYAYKHGSPLPPNQTDWFHQDRRARPNLTAVTSSAENAVDITRLPDDPADVEKLIKGLERWNPETSARGADERLTQARADQLAREIPQMYRRQMDLDKKLREGIPFTQADRWADENTRAMMKDIRIPFNDPDITARSGFDAFRYDDAGRTSWAFPDVSKMETPWGTKLGYKSMGEYPYRLQSGNYKAEALGHFKTIPEAVKFAERNPDKITQPRIFLGSEGFEIPKKRNWGYSDYLEADEKVQKQVAAKFKSKEDEFIKTGKTGPTKEQNTWAQHMYGDDYANLSKWGKEDVDNTLKNKHPSSLDEFEEVKEYAGTGLDELAQEKYGKKYADLTNTQQTDLWQGEEKPFKPINLETVDKIKHQIAKEDYADLYDNLDKEAKANVNDIYQDLVTTGDLAWSKKQYPSIAKELDEIHGAVASQKTASGKLKAAADKLKSSMGTGKPMPLTKEEILDDLAQSEMSHNYSELSPAKKEYIQNLYTVKYHKSTAQGDDAVVVLASDEAYGVKTFNVTKGDLKKFAKKGAALDPIAEHYYGKKYEDLSPGEADFVWDISTDALKYGDKE